MQLSDIVYNLIFLVCVCVCVCERRYAVVKSRPVRCSVVPTSPLSRCTYAAVCAVET